MPLLLCRRRRRRRQQNHRLLSPSPRHLLLLWLALVVGLTSTVRVESSPSSSSSSLIDITCNDESDVFSFPPFETVVLIKAGGSSITNKAVLERLNETTLDWLAQTIESSIHPRFVYSKNQNNNEKEANTCSSSCASASSDGPETLEKNSNCNCKRGDEDDPVRKNNPAIILVHGAGSFGHHAAKEFGLPAGDGSRASSVHQRRGLVKARLSVQTLNRLVVSTLVENGVHAVGISPCFGSMTYGAAAGSASSWEEQKRNLRSLVWSTLQAGLVPVLHGDACLFQSYNNNSSSSSSSSSREKEDSKIITAGILSGDIVMELLGTTTTATASEQHDVAEDTSWPHQVIFLTDVDGVYTSDPRHDPTAILLPEIPVQLQLPVDKNNIDGSNHPNDGESSSSAGPLLLLEKTQLLNASGSSHEHDVTGGLKSKLQSAIAIAGTGRNVTIIRCGSVSAQHVLTSISSSHRYQEQPTIAKQQHRFTVLYAVNTSSTSN